MEQSWRVAELLEEIARKADPASVLKKAIANGNRSGSMVSATVVFGGDECTAVYGFPLIVLLDLNMPRRNGFEFLEWVRQQPALRFLTVEVLTSSMRPQDLERALELGANSLFVKPGRIDDLVKLLRSWHQNGCHKTFLTLPFS